MRFFSIALVAGALVIPAVAAEASPLRWEKPREAAKLGFIALQCDKHDVCVAVACPEGKAQLVSISPGGGPLEGAATLKVGGRSHALSFAWDDAIIDVMGSAGARANVSLDALSAMRRENATLSGENTGPRKLTIQSAGFDGFWSAIEANCASAPPSR